MKLLFWFYSYWFIFFVNALQSQTPYAYQYNKNNGLRSNSIFDIHQDSNHYLWFATGSGLCRFNGVEFNYYTNQTQTMRSGSCIKEDSLGRIWYINFDGFLYYVEKNELKQFPQKNHSGFQNFGIVNNALYLVLEKSVEVYDLENFSLIEVLNFEDAIKFSMQVGNDFFVIDQNLIKIDQNLNLKTFLFPKDTNKDYLAPLLCAHQEKLYIISKFSKELFCFNGQEISAIQTPKQINFVQNLKSDGTYLWICTTKGFYRYDPKQETYGYFFEDINASTVFLDFEQNYWIGTLGEGIFMVPNFNDIFQKTTYSPKVLNLYNNEILVGTKNDEVYSGQKNINQSADNHAVTFLVTDTTNNRIIWASSKIKVFDTTTNQIIYSKILAVKNLVQIDHKYYAYAATGSIGFLKSNTTKHSFLDRYLSNFDADKDNYFERINLLSNLNGKAVAKSNDYIYFATNKGVFVFFEGKLTEILNNNKSVYISSLKVVNNEVIGLSTNDLVYRIDPTKAVLYDLANKTTNNNTQKIFSHQNVLFLYDGIALFEIKTAQQSAQKVFYSYITEVNDVLVQNNQMILATDKGILRKNINLKVKDFYTSFKITNLEDNHKIYDLSQKIEIKPNPEMVTINFEYVNFSPFDEHTINYKINASKWNSVNITDKKIQFVSLAPGNYEITIKLNNNEVKTLSFIVEKPWYLKWYTFVIGILGIVLITYKIQRRQHKVTQQKNKEALERIQLENNLNQLSLKAIKSQMNPHFFYNALNTIQSFILSNDKKQAVKYLSKFSLLTRNILTLTEKESVTIAEEIETLTLYLDIEKARFDEDFDYKILLEDLPDPDQQKIPAMLLQPFVENALKHGLLHKAGEKSLKITFVKLPEGLQILIDDNGIGRQKSEELNSIKTKQHQSFATQAILNRIDLINQSKTSKITIAFTDKYNPHQQSAGTLVTINIPY